MASSAESKPYLIQNWEKIQLELREKLILSDTEEWAQDMDRLQLIGGMDISYDKKDNSKACVTSVVLDAKNDLNIVYKHNTNITITNPFLLNTIYILNNL